MRSVLPEGLASGIGDEFEESKTSALLVRRSVLDLRDNFKRIAADPPMWPSEGKGVSFVYLVISSMVSKLCVFSL